MCIRDSGYPVVGRGVVPASQCLGVDPEAFGDPHGPGPFDRDQLHRGQPPAELVAGVPCEDQLAADKHPTPGLVLHQSAPICTAPAGTSIKGSCAVMIAIV